MGKGDGENWPKAAYNLFAVPEQALRIAGRFVQAMAMKIDP